MKPSLRNVDMQLLGFQPAVGCTNITRMAETPLCSVNHVETELWLSQQKAYRNWQPKNGLTCARSTLLDLISQFSEIPRVAIT